MSFLSDENLTFHRFSDGTISFTSERKKSMENALEAGTASMMPMAIGGLPKANGSGGTTNTTSMMTMMDHNGRDGTNLTIERRPRKHSYSQATSGSSPIWTTNTSFNNYTTNTITNSNQQQQQQQQQRRRQHRSSAGDSTSGRPSAADGETTTAGIPTLGDLRYLSSPTNPNNSSVIQNGSTVKLISTKASNANNGTIAGAAPNSDDQTNKQVRDNPFPRSAGGLIFVRHSCIWSGSRYTQRFSPSLLPTTTMDGIRYRDGCNHAVSGGSASGE
uniref:Putative serine/threonine-protein kinase dst3 n=1 Tax=Anopheles braziliensis TaxID=58242 RepID=A0A2M3Z057_9DIPT